MRRSRNRDDQTNHQPQSSKLTPTSAPRVFKCCCSGTFTAVKDFTAGTASCVKSCLWVDDIIVMFSRCYQRNITVLFFPLKVPQKSKICCEADCGLWWRCPRALQWLSLTCTEAWSCQTKQSHVNSSVNRIFLPLNVPKIINVVVLKDICWFSGRDSGRVHTRVCSACLNEAGCQFGVINDL